MRSESTLIFAAATRFGCPFTLANDSVASTAPARGLSAYIDGDKRFTPILPRIPSRHWVPWVPCPRHCVGMGAVVTKADHTSRLRSDFKTVKRRRLVWTEVQSVSSP